MVWGGGVGGGGGGGVIPPVPNGWAYTIVILLITDWRAMSYVHHKKYFIEQ